MCKSYTKENVPCGARLYYTSRNIETPQSLEMRYDEFKNEFDQDTSTIINAYKTNIISNRTDATLNTIQKERWIKNKH